MPYSASRLFRVFLCHSSGDKPAVREIYRRLHTEGWIDVWLDEQKLLPGQEWDIEIEKAVEQSDVVLVFLSNQSVDKEGYIQKELRFVLNIADEKPEGAIFVIPLRLDDCIIPRRLRNWQYVNYFPKSKRKNAYSRLIESLKLRAARLGIPTIRVTEEQAKREIEENTKKAAQSYKFVPDFRVRQRDYLLEISRALTQELNLERLLERILKVSVEMLAGQGGIVALKEQEGWQLVASHGVPPAFLNYLTQFLAEEDVSSHDVNRLNLKIKDLIYTASSETLNATALPLTARGEVIGDIFVFRTLAENFTKNDIALLQSFANQAAIAVANAQLHNKALTSKAEKGPPENTKEELG